MKRTNSLLSSFWVKVVPVFLLLVCIGFTNARAQNYKPLGEAIAAVKAATNALKATRVGPKISQGGGSGTQLGGKTSTSSSTAVLTVHEILYYSRFLELAQLNNDVATAVQALNAEVPASSDQARNARISQGKSDLLHLITY